MSLELLETLAKEASKHTADPEMGDTEKTAVAMDLKDIQTRYAAGCEFQLGDLVTPRKGYNAKGAGVPHIVVDVLEHPSCDFSIPSDPSDSSSSSFARRIDMRVITKARDNFVAHWVESWGYEPWIDQSE